ncbi:hypothetical protein HKD42_11745 [Altererythrobacter sp. RZ02]|uniref:Uncharacterized protein n=1 Tax=Pontixanthobacter rizhaonensis TaxID=2730337 RepID=A0A848QRL6_9SPHN|nr:hypothetical protein [Pontixanthobacter rizhaonensis]NMW32735.1 hypothetical protein [Pontixanthobacter rizhaonensis]
MYYDKATAALEQELRREEAKLQKIQDQAAEKKRKLRAVKSRLFATTKSDKWHAMALTAEARRIGFTGEHAEALFHLRNLSLSDYVEAVTPFANAKAEASILSVEYDAVRANYTDWTELGKHQHWDRARREYEAEVEGFKKWQAENPDKTSWRDKPATKNQYFLIWRTAEHLGIQQPLNLKCGEAHDWLDNHDANLRFRAALAAETDSQPVTAPPTNQPASKPVRDEAAQPKSSSSSENPDG